MSVTTSATTAVRLALSAVVMTFALSSAANASAPRTFVSGTGSDANEAVNCPVTSPCRSFAGAYAVTLPGGEIVALDTAGYGPITITSSLSIVGAHFASVTVAAGATGITIDAGSGTVILRNLQISGGGAANTTGIQLNSGHLILQSSSLKLLTTGLGVANSKADVTDTDIIGNITGVSTTDQGVDISVTPVTGATQVRLSGGNVLGNSTAYLMHDPGTCSTPAFGNKITVLIRLYGGGSFQLSTNQAGNTTLVSGTGSSCSPGNCQATTTYLDFTNANQN